MRRSFKGGLTLAAMVLAMGLCQGCGQTGTENAAPEAGADAANIEENADDNTAKDNGEEEENVEAGQEETKALDTPIKLMIENRSHYDYKEPDSYDTLMWGSYALVQLTDEAKAAYPELAKSIEEFDKKEEEEYLNNYKELLGDARGWYDELEDKESFYECYFKKNIDIVRADKAFLSIRVNEEDYMGGAHGSYGSGGYNFDSATGKELALKDVIPDIATLQNIVKDKLNEKYTDLVTLDSLDEAVPQYLTGEADQGCSWFITSEGVDIYFGIYQLGSYAAGTQTVSIRYDENPELFAEGFAKQEGDYVQAFGTWESLMTDVNGDGTVDSFEIQPVSEDYDWVNSLKFVVNGTESELEVYGYSPEPYLVHVGGNTYIYVEMTEENDYRETYAFRVTGDKVEKVGVWGGYITDMLPLPDYESDWDSYWESAFTSPGDLYIGNTIQIFSTHSGLAKAYINDAGELVKTEDYDYAIQYDDNQRYTTRKELTADVIDKDSFEVVSEGVTIPVGTKFSMYGTKGESIIDLMDSEGKLYRFNIKSDDWPQTIDGTDIEELFDGIMFAG